MKEILVVSPGGVHSTGGICRMVRDAAEAWHDGALPMRVLDSGGMEARRRMPWAFARALAGAVRACATGQAALLHVHVAARGSVVRKAAFVVAARACGVPALLHLHGADFEAFCDELGPIGRFGVGAVFRLASGVVVLGPRAAAHAEHALGVDRARLHVLPNAVPASRARPRDAKASPRDGDEPPHLVFLGALTERKGVDTLLAALAAPALRDAPWRLTLVGNGDRDRWRAEATRLGIAPRVAIPGWLPGEAARALLGQADMLLLPARQEAMPMVILEAMAAGLAVISTDVGEIGAVMLDGETGLLVPPGDAVALAAAIARLLASPDTRAAMGVAGQRRHRALYDLDAYAARLGALYGRMLPRAAPALPHKVAVP